MRRSSEENQGPEVDSEPAVCSGWSRVLAAMCEEDQSSSDVETSPADLDFVLKHWKLAATA